MSTTFLPAHVPGTPALYLPSGPTTSGAVAITFHFGGDAHLVAKLLDVLKAYQVQATLFAIGDWITANPLLTRRALANGHELGNHTKSHRDLLTLSREQVRDLPPFWLTRGVESVPAA